MAELRTKLEDQLKELNIEYDVIEHPEVFTVEAMMPYLKDIQGLVCKNLFVKDKKKKRLWLITAEHSKTFTLNDLAKKLNLTGGVRFADEPTLEKHLGVKQGCVTPLAVMHDTENKVNLILDEDLATLQEGKVYSHPMMNNATMGMSSTDFIKFLKRTNHEPIIINFNDLCSS